jgi:hypothetical protein
VTDDTQPTHPEATDPRPADGDDAHWPALDVPPPDGPVAPIPAPKPPMPDYKGEELDAERGPGLGCFWIQVGLLVFFILFTPLTVKLGWPPLVSAVLLFVTLGLLLFVGQTVIFLLRIVAAERRGRRVPVASRTRTVGEIEDAVAEPAVGGSAGAAGAVTTAAPARDGGTAGPSAPADPAGQPGADEGVRQ